MFKKAVIVLLLLTTPFAQARAVLICSMMNGQVVEQCCCPGHTEHVPDEHPTPDAPCCDVVVAVSDKAFAGVTDDQTTLQTRRARRTRHCRSSQRLRRLVPTFVVALRPPSTR